MMRGYLVTDERIILSIHQVGLEASVQIQLPERLECYICCSRPISNQLRR